MCLLLAVVFLFSNITAFPLRKDWNWSTLLRLFTAVNLWHKLTVCAKMVTWQMYAIVHCLNCLWLGSSAVSVRILFFAFNFPNDTSGNLLTWSGSLPPVGLLSTFAQTNRKATRLLWNINFYKKSCVVSWVFLPFFCNPSLNSMFDNQSECQRMNRNRNQKEKQVPSACLSSECLKCFPPVVFVLSIVISNAFSIGISN